MATTRVWGLALATVLAGCGTRDGLLDPPRTPAGAGGQMTSAGAGGTSGSGSGGAPLSPPDGGTPVPGACGCAPSRGVDVLMCGSQQAMTSWGIDAPYALLTPDGSTVVFNRCVPVDANGGCTMGVYYWTAGSGTVKLASNAWAYAISSDGRTVLGRSRPGDSNGGPAFLARLDGEMIELPAVGFARHLSADGSRVVGHQETGSHAQETVIWTAGADVVALGDLPGGPTASWPGAINDDASVIVGYGNTAAGQEPYRWTTGGPMIDLGLLPTSTVQAEALATSASGLVVAGASLTYSGRDYFRWTPSGGMAALTPAFDGRGPGPGAYFFPWQPPLVISRDGVVVAGTTADPTDPRAPAAFQWNVNAGTAQLLTPGSPSIVRAMNALGEAILGSRVQSSGQPASPLAPVTYTPFLWQPGGAKDLRALLESVGTDLDGLVLGDPIALSADGQTMVGHAMCGDAPVIYRAATGVAQGHL